MFLTSRRRRGRGSVDAPFTGRRRIGVVWAGSPKQRNDRNRSMPLQCLTPLFAAKRIDCISLQTEITAADRAAIESGKRLRHVGDTLRDFGDTAAVISMLDLVITVDTATAHLAGPWQSRCGSCCRSPRTDTGNWSGAIARGIRRRDCSAKRSPAGGTASLPRCWPNSLLAELTAD
jgi:hypothetical protein